MQDVYFFILTVPLAIAVTYFILYFLIPKFSGKDEKGKLFLWTILLLFAMGTVYTVYKPFVVGPILGLNSVPTNDILNLGQIISETFKWLAVISMAVAIKLIKSKTELQQKNEQLLLEKRIAELNFLKLQMHPHFLFNTLNTLYSKTIQNSEQAGQVIMQLSNLLRFMLEECNKPMVSLEKEIKVIKDYIELEKLRHGDRLNIMLSIPETSPEILISPLLFLPFIENSFKHSLNNIRGEVFINIELKYNSKALELFVENDHLKKKINGHSNGQGLANIKRQLELLYENEYKLSIDDHGARYRISLYIPIKPNLTHVKSDLYYY